MNSPIHLLIWLASFSIYFAPAIIAWARPVPHRWRVVVVNLFAFLVVPWVWALAMACRTRIGEPQLQQEVRKSEVR